MNLVHVTERALEYVPVLEPRKIGNVAVIGFFPRALPDLVLETERGRWKLYLWQHGLVRRRA